MTTSAASRPNAADDWIQPVAKPRPYEKGRPAHQADGDQERALAPEPIADRSEQDGAERSEREAGGEQAEGGNQRCGRF
ncbi:MAG: hypothetical protein LC656_02400 [Sphingomonadales bacterium]|nr:hypothetical protein [Sphingomonadales bacterium]